jgi:DNA-directed RNA polymerase subunit RPC12/RpoP
LEKFLIKLLSEIGGSIISVNVPSGPDPPKNIGAVMIKFNCPTCGKDYAVPEEAGGKTATCKVCKSKVVVPKLLSATPVISKPTPAEYSYPVPISPPPTQVPIVVITQAGNSDEAICPICHETIKTGAKRCKHCGETLDPVLRKAEEAERQAKQAQKNSRSRRHSSTVVVGDGSNSSNVGTCIMLEILFGLLCGTFGIGHFANGNPLLGLLFMFGYWTVTAINIALMFVLIGFVTLPLCWIMALIISPLMISATASRRGAVAVVHHEDM